MPSARNTSPGLRVARANVLPDGQHDRRLIVIDVSVAGWFVLAGAIGGACGAEFAKGVERFYA
jgi:hypothetical protein